MNHINIFAQINCNSFKGIKISIFSLSCNMSFNSNTRTLKMKMESMLLDKWKCFIIIVMFSWKHVYFKVSNQDWWQNCKTIFMFNLIKVNVQLTIGMLFSFAFSMFCMQNVYLLYFCKNIFHALCNSFNFCAQYF